MKTLLITLSSLLFALSTAAAEKRVALVIGCETYGSANTLKNPKNDAALLSARLKQLQFDSVLSFTDVTAKTFNRKLEEFKTAAFQADVAVFYFAGHGMEVEDINYLLPTDAVLEEAADLKQEAISLPSILTLLTEAQVKAKVVILDCCRDNPFANAQQERAWLRTRAFRSTGSEQAGLAEVKTELNLGTVVMFAAAPGKRAKDGPAGGNSPFATALAATLGLSGKDGSTPENVFETMMSVADAVTQTTGGVQEPWLKFDGQPQLLRRLAFAPVSLVRHEGSAPVMPFIPPPPPPPVMDDYQLLAGTTAGERKLIEVSPGVTVPFRWCPPGRFTMGSPASEHAVLKAAGKEESFYSDEVEHTVTLTKGFWLAETEVTQGQWQAVMGTTLLQQANRALADDTEFTINGKKQPYRAFSGMQKGEGAKLIGVESEKVAMYFVNWEEADEFCTKASRHAGQRGWVIALPTEAQWEYACRSGTSGMTYTGDFTIKGENHAPGLDAIAWYGGNSSVGYSGTGWNTDAWKEKQYPGGMAGPRRVGGRQANEWGLYDMLGNVWEWCADYYGPYAPGSATDPQGATTGANRVIRGGSWSGVAARCRAARRVNDEPGYRNYYLGFRPALVPSR